MRKTVTALAALGIVAALAAAVPAQAEEYGWGNHYQWGEGGADMTGVSTPGAAMGGAPIIGIPGTTATTGIRRPGDGAIRDG